MKKAFLTTLLVFGIILPVFATATYEQLYNCPSGYGVVPGKVWKESDCQTWAKEGTELYTKCTERVREYNNKTLEEFNTGKCTKSDIRASMKKDNCNCNIDFNLAKKKITSHGGVISGTENDSSYFMTGDNGCLELLAKELDTKYPQLNALTQLEADKEPPKPRAKQIKNINNYRVEKVNNTTFSKQYTCSYDNNGEIWSTYFDPEQKPTKAVMPGEESRWPEQVRKRLERAYEEEVAEYNKLVDLVNTNQCKSDYTNAELKHTDGNICSFYYDKNNKISGHGYQKFGNSSIDDCFTQLVKDIKQNVPNIYTSNKEYEKYGIPGKSSQTINPNYSRKHYQINHSSQKKQSTKPVKVNMPSAPVYK